jgi:hypothetical protein
MSLAAEFELRARGLTGLFTAIALAGVLVPAHASAAPAVAGTETEGEKILIVEAPGTPEDHRITVAYAGGTYFVSDPAGVATTTGCSPISTTTAGCPDNLLEQVQVTGGPGADVMALRSLGPGDAGALDGFHGADELFGSGRPDELAGRGGKDRLIGGAGRDTLRGGAAADLLDGGRAADSLSGGVGADKLIARDGRRDSRISCGAGTDRGARTDRVDPNAKSC